MKRKITMNETLILIFACMAGVILGAIFFGGLWWTVRRGVSSKHPAAWFLGSLLLRMSIALAGFYFVSGGRGERLAIMIAHLLYQGDRLASVDRRDRSYYLLQTRPVDSVPGEEHGTEPTGTAEQPHSGRLPPRRQFVRRPAEERGDEDPR